MTALPGVFVAFALLFLSDILKLSGRRTAGNVSFLCGSLGLLMSGVFAFLTGGHFAVAWPLRVISLLLAAVAAVLEVISLFTALPAKETYLGGDPVALVDTGMYALCRHPGALWLAALSPLMALGLGSTGLLWAGVSAALLNILYVLFQDKVVFPRMIRGYAAYQKSTPFLIPTRKSIRSAFAKRLQSGTKHEI